MDGLDIFLDNEIADRIDEDPRPGGTRAAAPTSSAPTGPMTTSDANAWLAEVAAQEAREDAERKAFNEQLAKVADKPIGPKPLGKPEGIEVLADAAAAGRFNFATWAASRVSDEPEAPVEEVESELVSMDDRAFAALVATVQGQRPATKTPEGYTPAEWRTLLRAKGVIGPIGAAR